MTGWGRNLFYWLSNEGLEFASQPKVIAYGNHFTIDPIARQFYLIQGVIPDPYSPYTEIKKLRAGEQFIYHLDTKFFDLQTYWDLHTNSCHFQPPKTFCEAKALITDAVRLRLNAKVPIGTFLSGGIDSSLVCAIVAKFNKNLCAYTAQFDNDDFDESKYAIEVARSLGVPI